MIYTETEFIIQLINLFSVYSILLFYLVVNMTPQLPAHAAGGDIIRRNSQIQYGRPCKHCHHLGRFRALLGKF